MTRGFELDIVLRPGLAEENATAIALGNLGAAELQRERKEPLEWKIVRVDHLREGHHFAILVRHPEHLIEFGVHAQLKRILEGLSPLSEEELLSRFEQAKSDGLRPIPLTYVEEQVDYWLDEDWTLGWVGAAMGIKR